MPSSKQEYSPSQELLQLDSEPPDKQPAFATLSSLGFEILEGSDWHKPNGQAAKITPSGQIEFCFTNPAAGVFLRAGPFIAAEAANAYDLISTTFLYLCPRRKAS